MGAQGGTYNSTGTQPTYVGGKGAYMEGNFTVTPGDTLKILVGQQGESIPNGNSGGGGGTFVWIHDSLNPLIIAGGGGGGGYDYEGIDATITTDGTVGNTAGNPGGTGTPGTGGNGASKGGCGWYTNGGDFNSGYISCIIGCGADPGWVYGGKRPLEGGAGGCSMAVTVGNGGFGGGSGAGGACTTSYGAGGGGGYSGGVGCYRTLAGGGGGGSFNSGTNQVNIPGYQYGNGFVIISWAVFVGTEKYEKTDIKLYPNPAKNILFIQGLKYSATVELNNINGALVRSEKLVKDNIDISTLATGMYFIKLNTEDGSVVRKFVKE